MQKYRLFNLSILFIPALSLGRAAPPPIIDMHLHALPVDFQGPPPQTICAPFSIFPAWDPPAGRSRLR